ncbi:MAG: hypothetical protein COW88_01460 [Candidatus Lloydbacteria bacterium CG22_combo_CG10-13_8_21_14_all_47_15]|uniref:DUF11 domain-containing protein n=1 Tax=Candidatus Lloydbacteria bacterium CG22_combo_CG10-13_8_21_14_all_47_15 TaxID=1974635 RepID=A0A2H0CUH6_9BACT|nr:MAG: hypothetical protein COW88_01460 [Candidatus Lloydbacteria bacterium CG22_combo_CG10-13_8_21_14_all_47_15]
MEHASSDNDGKSGSPDGGLDRLRKKLYRNEAPPLLAKHRLHEKAYNLPPEWELNRESDELSSDKLMSKPRLTTYILVSSIIFFFIALGVAAYVLLGGGNTVSSKNIGIEIAGPVSVAGGEELSFQISVKNDNALPIEFADLLIEYPPGTRRADNVTEPLLRVRKSLGTIGAGELVNEVVRSVLFGEEQSLRPIAITLEYRVEGSNAIFVKETSYDVTISSSPLRVTVDAVDEVSVNQEITLTVTIESASENIVGDVAVKVEYPFGFEFKEANLTPVFSENTWVLGDMPKGGKKTIRITGVMRGQNEETKVFRIVTGTLSDTDETKIGVAYSTLFEEVSLRQPFLGASLTINGKDAALYVASPSQRIDAMIEWKNTLPVRVTDAVIEVSLVGNAFNPQTVSVSKGIYDSSANVIRWDQRSMPELGSVESGESGSLQFAFLPRSFVADTIVNPYVELALSVRGKRVSETAVPEEVRTFVRRVIRFVSDVQLSARSTYFAGPFANRGPLPPKVETETTYTVIWTIVNSSNDISGANISAILPGYVHWLGVVTPQNERVTYDPDTGIVRWDAGDIPLGTGFSVPAREVAFQVALFPSANHVGKALTILLGSTLVGRDQFADTDIEVPGRALTTSLTTDPSFRRDYDKVVE